MHFRLSLARFGRSFTSSSKVLGKGDVVTLQYADLVSGKDVSKDILAAYGPKGLAHLPDEAKAKLEHAESMYNVGWSHGKEKMGDKPDFAKGSYYCNPLYDEAGTPAMRAKYPFFYPKNIWPKDALPELEPAFKTLGKIMYDTTVLLTKQIDTLAQSRLPTYEKSLLYNNFVATQKIKGRVLYYYPAADTASEDGWIAWHNDSGFLTALTSDMFFNDDTGEVIPNPDPQGGLWIVDRSGGAVKVNIPEDNLAVQCGECLQIMTGGLLVATPHAVKASKAPKGMKVGRGTFPVFIDTEIDFPLSPPKGVSRDAVFDRTIESRVPPLADRWERDGVPFVEFLGTTFQRYYEWTTKK